MAALLGWGLLAGSGCGRRVVAAAFVVVASASAGYALARPAVAFIASSRGGVIAASLITTAFFVARSAASPVAGYLGDTVEGARSAMLRYALFLAAASIYGVLLVQESPLAIVLLAGLWGLASGLYWPSLQYAVSRVGGTSALGVYFGLGSLGGMAGYLAYAAPSLGDQEAILASGLLVAASAAVASILFRGVEECLQAPREARRSQYGRRGGVLVALSAPFTAWVLYTSLLLGASRGLMGELLYVYLVEVQGVTRALLGLALGAAQAAGLAASIVAGYAGSTIGVARSLRAVLLLGAAGLLMVSLHAGPYTASLGVVLAQAAGSAGMPLTRNTLIASDQRYAGTVIGLSNTISNIGAAVAPVAAALLYEARLFEALPLLAPEGAGYAALAAAMLVAAIIAPRPR